MRRSYNLKILTMLSVKALEEVMLVELQPGWEMLSELCLLKVCLPAVHFIGTINAIQFFTNIDRKSRNFSQHSHNDQTLEQQYACSTLPPPEQAVGAGSEDPDRAFLSSLLAGKEQ